MNTDTLAGIDPRLLGNELKRARKQQKMRQEDAALILEVARTTITAIENGDRRIRPNELIKLARAYNRPVSEFVRLKPTVEPFTTVQFRGPTKQTEEEKEETELDINDMENLCRDYLELEKIVGKPLRQSYPLEYVHTGTSLEAEAEALAQNERNRLGLGHGPLANLRDILEQDVGIRIFYVPLRSNKLSAMYYFSAQIGACIVINSKHPEYRCRWSLAHDYCHFLVDRYQPSITVEDAYQRVPRSEQFADAFARFLLLPTSKVVQALNDIKQQGAVRTRDLLVLANRFGVSMQALALRIEELGLLKGSIWDRIERSDFSISDAQKQLGLENIPGRRDMFPLHYRRLAIEAYQDGRITLGSLTRYLRHDDPLVTLEEIGANKNSTEGSPQSGAINKDLSFGGNGIDE
jgi:Zn-dependent peptidase ImmA (M78 family)/DNA-binding XRE family transcriptional regulator